MTSVKLMKLLMVAAALAAGCGNDSYGAQGKSGDTGIERDALRVKTDPARGRLWVLGLDGVRVYDAASRRLVRAITLPGWSVASFVCNPDLVLDRAGGAIISSNVQSRLWQVNGESFAVTGREITLVGRERWEAGFGGLAQTANGSLYALTANGVFLWKIDVAGARASLVETYHPPLKGCAVPAQRSR